MQLSGVLLEDKGGNKEPPSDLWDWCGEEGKQEKVESWKSEKEN